MSMTATPYDFLTRPAILTRGNVTSFVEKELREAIVRLVLPPGMVLDKPAICARLGVSRFPVSEALARLQAEGLVDILPQRGSTVSRIRMADVAEFMFMRKALESEAIRLLVDSGGAHVVAGLAETLEAQTIAAEADDRDTFHALDCAFHEALLTALDFRRVKSIIEGARANVDRARRAIQSPRRDVTTIAEHKAILDGIVSGDGERAAGAMRAHIDAVMEELTKFAADHPELFADGEGATKLAQ